MLQNTMVRLALLALLLAAAFATITVKEHFKFDADTTAVTRVVAQDNNNNLWLATGTGIVRFNVGNKGRTGSVALVAGETAPTTLAIDATSTYGYFTTTFTNPQGTVTRLVQFSLQNLTRTDSINLYDHETSPTTSHFNAAQTSIFLGLNTPQAQVVQISVPKLTRVGAITLQDTEKRIASSAVDTVNNIAYYSCDAGNFVSVNLNTFQRIQANKFSDFIDINDKFPTAATDGTSAYFASATSGVIHKVTFGATGALTYAANVTLATPDAITGLAVDATNVYALQSRSPARVHKFDKNLGTASNLDLTPADEINGVQLLLNQGNLWVTCQIGGATPLTMVMVNAATLTRTSAGYISELINDVRLSALDGSNNFVIVNGATPSVIFQIRRDGTLISKFTLEAGDQAKAITTGNGRIYVAADQGGQSFLYTLTVSPLANVTAKVQVDNVNPVASIFVDSSYMYVAGGNNGYVSRLPLNTVDPSTVTVLQLLTAHLESRFIAAAVDPSSNFVWAITSNVGGTPTLLKIRTTDFVRVSVPRSIIGDNDLAIKSMAVSPDGKYVYIVSKITIATAPFSRTDVIRISTTEFTRQQVSYTATNYLDPLSITVDNTGEYIYVTTNGGSIFIVDAATLGLTDSESRKFVPAATSVYTKAKFISNYFSYVTSSETPSQLYTMTFCPPGYVINGETCNKCLKGFYASAGIECLQCPLGHYCENDAMTSPSPCPAGTASNALQQTSNATCVACQAGFYQNSQGSSMCLDCPTGGYCPTVGTVTPTPCPAGSYSNSTQQVSNSTCIPCSAGYYQTSQGSNFCQSCPSGTFSQEVGSAVMSCTSCYPGSTSDAGSAWCRLCPPGYEGGSNPSQCTLCGLGKYSNSYGATSCSSCPVGSFQDKLGSTSCQQCQPGTVKATTGSTTPCTVCPKGTYQAMAGQAVCLDCPAGFYSNKTMQTECNICPPGFSSGTLNGDDRQEYCAACPAGTYAPTAGTPKCIDCPVGSFSANYNSTSCELCPPGFFQGTTRSTGCAPCNIGQYSNKYGSTACQNCPAGMFNNATGQTGCVSCGPGFVARATGAGRYYCDICPAGKYADQQTASGACIDCAAGYYQSKPGQSTCLKCPAGFFSTAGSTECKPCGVGTFSLEAALTCTACPPHTYAPSLGSTQCLPCAPGYDSAAGGSSQCTPCQLGFYNNRAGGVCRQCPSGWYGPDVAATSCKQCPAGFRSAAGQVKCTACNPGEYQPNAGSTSCIPCVPGTFAPGSASTDCDLCPVGTTSTAGATDCSACAIGKFADKPGSTSCRDCAAGTWTYSERSASCFVCPAGTFLATTSGSFRTCTPCALGTYNNREGDDACTQCPAGMYQDTYGATECKKCPAGTFAATAGRTGVADCQACPQGTFSEEGATGCRACPLGSISFPALRGTTCKWCPAGTVYHVASGVASCVPCPAGTYNPQEGIHNQPYAATIVGGQVSPIGFLTIPHDPDSFVQSCIPCPVGTFASTPGSASCSPCPLSTYASTNGTARCTPCPGNTFSNKLGSQNYTDCTSTCSPGFVANTDQTSGTPCLACKPGTYFESKTGTCNSCGVGEYQDLSAQLQCKPCANNSTEIGQSKCQVCQVFTIVSENGQLTNRTICTTSGALRNSASWILLILAISVSLLALF